MSDTDNQDKTKGIWLITPQGEFKKLYLLIFVLAFGVLGVLLNYNSWASKPPFKPGGKSSSSSPALSLLPSSQKVPLGSTLPIEIWADVPNQLVNSVQANLLYPADKLTFLNIDTSNSSFGVTAQSSGGGGMVYIARGNIGSLTGHLYVATVNFKSIADSGKAAVIFASGTSLVSSTTNINILAATYGGSYSLTQ